MHVFELQELLSRADACALALYMPDVPGVPADSPDDVSVLHLRCDEVLPYEAGLPAGTSAIRATGQHQRPVTARTMSDALSALPASDEVVAYDERAGLVRPIAGAFLSGVAGDGMAYALFCERDISDGDVRASDRIVSL